MHVWFGVYHIECKSVRLTITFYAYYLHNRFNLNWLIFASIQIDRTLWIIYPYIYDMWHKVYPFFSNVHILFEGSVYMNKHLVNLETIIINCNLILTMRMWNDWDYMSLNSSHDIDLGVIVYQCRFIYMIDRSVTIVMIVNSHLHVFCMIITYNKQNHCIYIWSHSP